MLPAKTLIQLRNLPVDFGCMDVGGQVQNLLGNTIDQYPVN